MAFIPNTEAHRGCRQSVERVNKQRAFAWAKYYEQISGEAGRALVIVNYANVAQGNQAGVRPENIPTHITNELYDMACELRKKFECPVCLEQVNKETIQITFCGHIYCKGCLTEVKALEDPKCSICRKKL